MKNKFYLLLSSTAILFLFIAKVQAAISVTNPLGSVKTVPDLAGKVIAGIVGIVGALALLMFVWGGVLWMTSGGNTDRVQKGKTTLIWSTIGLFVIFASYALVRTILDALAG